MRDAMRETDLPNRGSMSRMRRTVMVVAVFVPVALCFAASAFAVTVTSFSGAYGRASSLPYCYGSTLTITGTGFVNDGSVPSVTVGGVPALKVTVGSDTTLFALIGPGATTGPVVVTTAKGTATSTTNENIFPCASGAPTTAPIVKSLPAKATAGKKIALSGSGFVGTTGVTVGGAVAAYAIPSDNLMYVVIPKGATNDATTGKLIIKITSPAGSASVATHVK